jgi:predicted ATPase/DNA-binding SARP family transcriptional activator
LATPGDLSADRLVVADRAPVGLHAGAFTTDLQELQAALQAADRAASPEERTAHLTKVALHGGELLPEMVETWVLPERESVRESQVLALHQLVGVLEGVGERERALAYAHQAVRLDPLREESHCDLMRLYATAGQPAAAERQFQELTRLLSDELGEAPSAATRALAEELRNDTRALFVVRRDLSSAGERRPSEAAEAAAEEPAPTVPAPGAVRPPPVLGRLPVQLTRFFGREEEIAWLTGLLSASKARLVTVTGPDGSGKTRLAIAGVGRLEEFFGEAITFVPLADLTDAARISDAIADALALPRSPQVEVLDQVVAELSDQGRRAHHGPLLLLDNFEHLLASPPLEGSSTPDGSLLVRRLLERVPTLCLLVTSRQRLGLGGEQELALLPLPTPRRVALLPQMEECASVQLFADRARSVRADFQLTEANATAVAELCDRLDGLPLALELAAARAAVLSPAQLLEQLERRFELLVTRQRDLPSRHRTLLATVEGSYQALPLELQRFFKGLSVFRGGWTLAAAQAVCEERRALDFLTELRERSLVAVEARGGGGTPPPSRGTGGEELRYRLLETLRQYAWEQLTASGGLSAARQSTSGRCRKAVCSSVKRGSRRCGPRAERCLWRRRRGMR